MKNGRKVTLILDSSHHSMRLISVARKEETAEEGYRTWKYMYLNGIFKYLQQFEGDEMIVAVDSRKNWRKDVYPYYKAHRKILRKADDAKGELKEHWFNFPEYFERYNELLEEVKKHLPVKVVEVEYAEADDVAAVLSYSEDLKENEVVMITTDGDYVQLLEAPHRTLYSPIKKKIVRCDDPKSELLMKIFTGDKGDFVPSIADRHTFKPEFLEYCVKELDVAKSESNAKVKLLNDETILMESSIKFQQDFGLKPSRVMGFSAKEAKGLINNDEVELFLNEKGNEELKKMFLRNNKLVNLRMQPKEIKSEILDVYKEYGALPKQSVLFKYFVKNKYNGFLDNLEDISATLEPLYDKKPTNA